MRINPSADWFFDKPTPWQAAYNALRPIVLSCGLEETIKWGCPCYTLDGKNIVLIHGFKDYCALLFMQGALLTDPQHILVQQTENVQAARQLRFTDLQQILDQQLVIQTYVQEAMNLQETGTKVVPKKTNEYAVPSEFQEILNQMPDVKSAFEALTPGRQRGYLLYFSAAKRAQTRVDRIEKMLPKIMRGKGLED